MLKINYPVNEEDTGHKLYYYYQSFEKRQYILKVSYIDADKENAESYISNRFDPIDRIQKYMNIYMVSNRTDDDVAEVFLINDKK